MFPLLQTQPEDLASLRALTEQVVREPPDYLLANTGYGMRTWLALGREWGLQEDSSPPYGPKTTIAARGAKALGELRKVGLDAWYKAPGETLEEVVARLTAEDLAVGRSWCSSMASRPGPPSSTLEQAGRQGQLPARLQDGRRRRGGGGGARRNAPGRCCRCGHVHRRPSGAALTRCRSRRGRARPGN